MCLHATDLKQNAFHQLSRHIKYHTHSTVVQVLIQLARQGCLVVHIQLHTKLLCCSYEYCRCD